VSGALRLEAAEIEALAAAGKVEAVGRRSLVALDVPVVAVIVEGYFRIFRNAAFARDVTLGLASAGDVLAPASAFGDRSAETGAEALGEGKVLKVARERFEELGALRPDLYLRVAGSIGRRLLRLQTRIEQFSRATAEARVASVLLELADDYGIPAGTGLKLDLPLSQEELARLAGTTRETTSSAVAEFARRGAVKGGRLRGLVVLDRGALEQAAGSG
jgi:CRP/FNR family transcriptional regulator